MFVRTYMSTEDVTALSNRARLELLASGRGVRVELRACS